MTRADRSLMEPVKNAVIVGLLVCTIVLARAVVRLENYRYANSTGFCSEYANDPLQYAQREKCLFSTETRTNGLWHLYHALTE